MSTNTTDKDREDAYKLVERMGLGYEFRMCTCGQLPCARLEVVADALATVRSEVWKEAMKITNTCLQEHSHVADEYGERQNPASCIWFELESAAANRQ